MSQPALERSAAADPANALDVLGIGLRCTSNDPEIAAACVETFAPWGAGASGRGSMPAALHAVVDAFAGDGAARSVEPAGPVRHLARGLTLRITAAGVDVTSDASTGRIRGRVRPELLRDPSVRRDVLEAAVLWAIAHGPHDRVPLHATAVAADGAALLLTGPSGAGKSTLAYAAARAGLRILGESVWVQRLPLRVWGSPGAPRLTPASARFFPELAEMTPRADLRGRVKVEPPPRYLPADRPPFVERFGICVLDRAPVESPRWSRLSGEELHSALLGQLEEGFALLRERTSHLAPVLAERGAWRLRIGERPDAWVPALRALLEEVARTRDPRTR